MVKPKVAFATHAYYKDWRVVLNPKRFETVLKSHKYDFDQVIVVINNIYKGDQKKVLKYAENLLKTGLVTDILVSEKYLTKSVLTDFNIDFDFFWKNNPYFSSAQLSALHYLREKVDFVLHMSGDVWLQKCGEWIAGAMKKLEEDENMIGFNICRNIYIDKYPIWAHSENDNFWISNGELKKGGERRGFGLSDLAYVLKTKPKIYYDFSFSKKELYKYNNFWPSYARPCFEMYIRAFLDKYSLNYGALKPKNEVPVTKHKNFSSFQLKNLFYLYAGFYTNGKYAPKCK